MKTNHCFIDKVLDDVLLRTFLINTERPDYKIMPYVGSHQGGNESFKLDISTYSRSASQVCRRWREIILNSSYLWSRLLTSSEMSTQWFKEVLRRTGSAPLQVYTGHGETASHFQNVVALLAKPRFINRLDTFHGTGIPRRVLDAFKKNRFPTLKQCTLLMPVPRDERGRMEIREFTKPTALFANHAPFLRHLELFLILPKPSSSFLPTLTVLRLYYSTVSLASILDVLDHASTLQELVLFHSMNFQRLVEPDQVALRTVILPHLSYLHIEDRFSRSLVGLTSSLRSTRLEKLALYLNVVDAPSTDLSQAIGDNMTGFFSPFVQALKGSIPSLSNDSPFAYQIDIYLRAHSPQFIQSVDKAAARSNAKLPPPLRVEVGVRHPFDLGSENSAIIAAMFYKMVGSGSASCSALNIYCEDEGMLHDEALMMLFLPLMRLVHLQIWDTLSVLRIFRVLMSSTLGGIIAQTSALLKAIGETPDGAAQLQEAVAIPELAVLTLLPSLAVLTLPRSCIINKVLFSSCEQFIKWRKEKGQPISMILFREADADDIVGNLVRDAEDGIWTEELRRERLESLNTLGVLKVIM